MYIILAILMFEVIIMIHEFGHYLAAKKFNVGIVEYSIGMGPILFFKRIGETVYSLRLCPVGGYCAMVGEQSPETADKGQESRNEKSRKKPKREPEYKTDWSDDRLYSSKPKWQQLIILIAGPLSNVMTGFLVALISVIIFGSNVPPTIDSFVSDDCPAVQAGLEIGDLIIKVDNRDVLTYSDFKTYIECYSNRTDESYVLTVQKADGSEYVCRVSPDPETGLIGISINAKLEKKHGLDILKYAWNEGVYWVRTTFDSFYMLTHGGAKVNDLSGVVGTTAIISDTLETAEEVSGIDGMIATLIEFAIFISINLAIMNLLPLPALDGGRALITYIEGLLNKTMSPRMENIINATGFAFLMILMLATTFNDVIKIIIGQV